MPYRIEDTEYELPDTACSGCPLPFKIAEYEDEEPKLVFEITTPKGTTIKYFE